MADIGAVTLELVTASGFEPGGAPSLQQLTAFGFEPGGAPTLALLTASGLSQGSDAFGTAVLEVLTATGVHDVDNVAAGAVILELATAFGYAQPVSAPVLELLTASGTALNGGDGVGTIVLLSPVVSGTALSAGDAVGAAMLQALMASGSALNGGDARGAATLQRLQAIARGDAGTTGSGAVTLQLLVATGAAYADSTGSGAATLSRLVAYGQADAAVVQTFRGWAMNTRHNGLTEYTNFPYNSFARFNNAYLAAGPGGIYVLGGSDDDGVPIAWTLRTGMHDDKKPVLKRLAEVLLGARYDATVRAKVFKDEGVSYDYVLPALRTSNLQQVRLPVGKGIRSRYYQVELSGEGAHFELDSMQMVMTETTRRVG